MHDLGAVLTVNAGLIAAMMVALWAASLRLADASIVDRFWGPGFVLVAAASATLSAGWPPRVALIGILVALWGGRLGLHITRRNLGAGEDYRYAAMRRHWGPRFGIVSLATVFGLQAALMWLVSLPVAVAMAAPSPTAFTVTDVAGTLLWLAGFGFEAIGDAQLRRFRAEAANHGKVMDQGLWRYTRHPNYFGDALLWWGLWLVAAGVDGGAWTVVSPLVMTFLLRRISGVPLLEKHMRRSRPGYEEYCRRTSEFFPRPPAN
jgi:steroid 5-alpha reductase family enzyme